MKKFLLGFICGAIVLFSIPVLAETAYQILDNKFPIFLNGVEQKVEAYNINGYTYLKLADVAKVLNATVKFNEVDSIIEILAQRLPENNLAEKDKDKNNKEESEEEVIMNILDLPADAKLTNLKLGDTFVNDIGYEITLKDLKYTKGILRQGIVKVDYNVTVPDKYISSFQLNFLGSNDKLESRGVIDSICSAPKDQAQLAIRAHTRSGEKLVPLEDISFIQLRTINKDNETIFVRWYVE